MDVIGKTSSFLSQILLKRSEKSEYQTIQTWDMKFLCCWNDMGKSASFPHFEFLRILKISLTRQVKSIWELFFGKVIGKTKFFCALYLFIWLERYEHQFQSTKKTWSPTSTRKVYVKTFIGRRQIYVLSVKQKSVQTPKDVMS